MAKVTYQDSLGKRSVETKPAFLLEDEAFLATRNGATIRNQMRLPLRMIDSLSMATVCVFEYMIGNTDWSLPFLHNIKLLERKDTIRAVPYDFDHSGIVNTKYAHPPEQLNLMSVRERLYRGLKYSPAMFQQVFDNFRRNKAQIYALYEGNPQLNASYIKSTIKYLDEFYSDINDPKSLKRTFVEGGGKDGSQGITIKGFDN